MMHKGILREIEGIIFDMDGTLLDSMWVWTAVDEEYLKKYQLSVPDTFHEDIEGMSFSETARYFLNMFPNLCCTVQEIMDEWTRMALDKYKYEVKEKQGVREFLDSMKREGVKLGIATSCARELVEGALDSLNISQYFDTVRTACEAKKGKPAPDIYLMVAQEIRVSPENCLVFEDVPMGILAGKRAGMQVCAVDDEFSRHQERKKRELADYYIQSYKDIANGTYEVLS